MKNKEKNLIAVKVRKQAAQIELLRKKIFLLQEALIKANGIPSCELNQPLSSISPVVSKLFPESNKTVIAFGGMISRLGMPPAEFLNTFLKKQINVIFVKDFYQCWYQKGLLGVSSSVDETVNFLTANLPSNQEKIYTIGTSAGGYAAILFGVLLNANKILAFGPQTIITEQVFNKFKSNDSRIEDINFNSEYTDLSLLLNSVNYNSSIHIHYSQEHLNDKIAAERLESFKQVHLHAWEAKGHNIAKWLKEKKMLDLITDELLNS